MGAVTTAPASIRVIVAWLPPSANSVSTIRAARQVAAKTVSVWTEISAIGETLLQFASFQTSVTRIVAMLGNVLRQLSVKDNLSTRHARSTSPAPVVTAKTVFVLAIALWEAKRGLVRTVRTRRTASRAVARMTCAK